MRRMTWSRSAGLNPGLINANQLRSENFGGEDEMIVPARDSVEKTSSGITTSEAPLSIVKSSVMALLTWTGRTRTPASRFSRMLSASARFAASAQIQVSTISMVVNRTKALSGQCGSASYEGSVQDILWNVSRRGVRVTSD